MFFVLSKVLWLLLNPGNLLALLLALGATLEWRRRSSLGRLLVSAAALSTIALVVLPLGDWLNVPLENRFSPPDEAPPRADGIIVLGGAVAPDRSEAHGHPALNQSIDRMLAFITLARRYSTARLLFSGGNGALFPGARTEADVARAFFADIAPDLTRIEYEAASRNTHENAELSFRQIAPKPGESWLLITSAAHMARAVGCFRHAGWQVIAWPVDYRTGGSARFDLAGNLARLDGASKEWLGLLAYRIEGYTDTLLPAP